MLAYSQIITLAIRELLVQNGELRFESRVFIQEVFLGGGLSIGESLEVSSQLLINGQELLLFSNDRVEGYVQLRFASLAIFSQFLVVEDLRSQFLVQFVGLGLDFFDLRNLTGKIGQSHDLGSLIVQLLSQLLDLGLVIGNGRNLELEGLVGGLEFPVLVLAKVQLRLVGNRLFRYGVKRNQLASRISQLNNVSLDIVLALFKLVLAVIEVSLQGLVVLVLASDLNQLGLEKLGVLVAVVCTDSRGFESIG